MSLCVVVGIVLKIYTPRVFRITTLSISVIEVLAGLGGMIIAEFSCGASLVLVLLLWAIRLARIICRRGLDGRGRRVESGGGWGWGP